MCFPVKVVERYDSPRGADIHDSPVNSSLSNTTNYSRFSKKGRHSNLVRRERYPFPGFASSPDHYLQCKCSSYAKLWAPDHCKVDKLTHHRQLATDGISTVFDVTPVGLSSIPTRTFFSSATAP